MCVCVAAVVDGGTHTHVLERHWKDPSYDKLHVSVAAAAAAFQARNLGIIARRTVGESVAKTETPFIFLPGAFRGEPGPEPSLEEAGVGT